MVQKIICSIFLLFTGSLTLFSNPDSTQHMNLWTRFRGVGGLGIDHVGSAPISWDSTGFSWEISLPGVGNASPIAWDNTIYVTSVDSEKSIGYLMAIEAKDGSIRWQKEFQVSDLTMHPDNNLATPTPAIDQSQVYVIWYSKEKSSLTALDHNGNIRWQSDFGGMEARHGGGSSLALTKNSVVFTREQEEGSTLSSSWIAVDKKTGQLTWELERETVESNSFSTPLLLRSGQLEKVLIFASESHGLTGVEPETGQVLWERKDLFSARVVASPFYAEGFIIACRRNEALTIKLDEDTFEAADSIHYRLPRNLSPYVPTPIAVGEHLFLFMDNGTVACVKLHSGEIIWKERPAGPIYGSPICVGKTLYCITKAGKVIVLSADSTYQLHNVYDLGDGSFSTPIMSGSGMAFRTFSKLFYLRKP